MEVTCVTTRVEKMVKKSLAKEQEKTWDNINEKTLCQMYSVLQTQFLYLVTMTALESSGSDKKAQYIALKL